MTEQELRDLVDNLMAPHHETEWVEFKRDYTNPHDIGEYLSALSNSARLHNQPYGYIVWGIQDGSLEVVGTDFIPATSKVKGEPLESWLIRYLVPSTDFRIHRFEYEAGKSLVVFEIDAVRKMPLQFKDIAYIRVGEVKRKLDEVPAKQERLEFMLQSIDWSSEICHGATIADLDPGALAYARKQFREKHQNLAGVIDTWDDITFLNKARLAVNGKITRTAIILIGKNESSHYLSPAVAQITWVLKDEAGNDKDYGHFGPPLLLSVDEIYGKIRNLTLRALPSGTLFPVEISQYDSWVLREALHNAIAHQDYTLNSRINIIERPDEIVIANAGHFIPGTVEEAIRVDSTPSYYRNAFLASAMVNLNMIDTIGSGIRRMFIRQRERFFPMPAFDLIRNEHIKVHIPGRILDENYTRLLISKTDLDLDTVILLDKVQKKFRISREQAGLLRMLKLVEGRYPNLYPSSHLALLSGQKASYIKNRGLNDEHYIRLIIDYLKEYGSATRKEIDNLLLDKLSDILTNEQRIRKISRLLSVKMAGRIVNTGSKKSPKWVLRDEENI